LVFVGPFQWSLSQKLQDMQEIDQDIFLKFLAQSIQRKENASKFDEK
jgi:hypothetical protein